MGACTQDANRFEEIEDEGRGKGYDKKLHSLSRQRHRGSESESKSPICLQCLHLAANIETHLYFLNSDASHMSHWDEDQAIQLAIRACEQLEHEGQLGTQSGAYFPHNSCQILFESELFTERLGWFVAAHNEKIRTEIQQDQNEEQVRKRSQDSLQRYDHVYTHFNIQTDYLFPDSMCLALSLCDRQTIQYAKRNIPD